MNTTNHGKPDSNGSADDPASHLNVIVDLNPVQWHLSSLSSNEHPLSLSQFLSQLLVFINSHLAGKDDNTVAVIGAFPSYSKILLSSADGVATKEEAVTRQHANSYQPFRVVDATLTQRIQDEMDKLGEERSENDRGLVGAITKGLCHINRIIQPPPSNTANSHGTSSSNTPSPRLLILSVSSDLSTSYIPLMNSIFAAQKLRVKIDVCKLFGSDTVFLQQAAHLTGGAYVSLERKDALLQYLTMCFLPTPALRKILGTPTQDKIDFRAACFCHKKTVDIGYVCSICLSIFCKPIPVCSTCRTKFPLKTLQRLGFGKPGLPANGHNKITQNGVGTPPARPM